MSSTIKHGALFLLIMFWTWYSWSNKFDRPIHFLALAIVAISFARVRHLQHSKVIPPARLDFENEDPTDLQRPTVLRRQEQSGLRIV